MVICQYETNFDAFYARAKKLPYFTYLSESRPVITADSWYMACSEYSPAGVFEALLRNDAGAPASSDIIWGDKTPSYLVHMPLLKQLYPSARFIHIVRDVRDYCLSSRQAWGKHMYRAAQLWVDRLLQAEVDARLLGDDYLRLHYEELISDPASCLTRACGFLDVLFQQQMLVPSKPAENLGDTRGESRIVADNASKYRTQMPIKVQQRIEQLAGNQLRRLGYPVFFESGYRRISAPMMLAYQLMDSINLVRFEVKNRGLLEAIRFRWRLFTTSNSQGNRSHTG